MAFLVEAFDAGIFIIVTGRMIWPGRLMFEQAGGGPGRTDIEVLSISVSVYRVGARVCTVLFFFCN